MSIIIIYKSGGGGGINNFLCHHPATTKNSLWTRSSSTTPKEKPTLTTNLSTTQLSISNITSGLSQWECSQEYDKVMKIIAKNRRVLITTFNDLNMNGTLITFNIVKDVFAELLRNNSMTIKDEYWPFLLKIAEKDTIIDYKFLLDLFKERSQLLVAHPKHSVM